MGTASLRVPLCLLTALALAATASADLLARSKLQVAVRSMEPAQAHEVLLDHSFDSGTLGMALQTVAIRAYPEDEEPAIEMARLLINKGADVNYRDDEGRTPLMECAAKGLAGVAGLLFSAGADLDLADNAGRTVWEHADGESELGRDMVALLDAERDERQHLKRVCKISNLSARIKGDCVIISYDLEAPEKVPVKLVVSDNYGRTYSVPVTNATGHVGNVVTPGQNRQIVWEVNKDVPGGLEKTDILIDLQISRL